MNYLTARNRNAFDEQTFCKQMNILPQVCNHNIFGSSSSLDTTRPESEYVYDTLEASDAVPTQTTDTRRGCRRYIRNFDVTTAISNDNINTDTVINCEDNHTSKPWKQRGILDYKPRRTCRMISLGFIFGLVFGAMTFAVVLLFMDKLNGSHITCEVKQNVNTETGKSSPSDVSDGTTLPVYETTESEITSTKTSTSLYSTTSSSLVSNVITEVTGSVTMSTVDEASDSLINSTTVIPTSEDHETVRSAIKTTTTQGPAPPYKRSVNEMPGGYIYTRWGSYLCPENSDQLYKGYMAGGHYKHPGGATNSICLPEVPEWGNYSDGIDTDRALIYGTEYGGSDNTFNTLIGENIRYKDVPCTVCQATGRLSHIMIPARTSCLDNWTLEYKGYLMGSSYLHSHSSQLVCIDSTPDHVTNSNDLIGGHILYFAEIRTGILPNPPYINGREISCVVCTR